MERESGNSSHKSFIRWSIIFLIFWILYWLVLIDFKTSLNPIVGLITISSSIFISFVLPFFMSLALNSKFLNSSFPEKGDDGNHKRRMESTLLYLSLSMITSFLYTMVSGIFLSVFRFYNLIGIISTSVIIPISICVTFRSTLKKTVSFLVQRFSEWNYTPFFFQILMLCLIVRFPLLIDNQIGVDSRFFHILTIDLLNTETLSWVLSPLSFIELYPASVVVSSIFYTANLTLLSGFEIEFVILVLSITHGIISTITFPILVKVAEHFEILPNESFPYAFSLFAFMPLFLKFTDWTSTGRQLFLFIAPCAFSIFLITILSTNTQIKKKIFIWLLLSFSLLLSHGLGRVVLVFGVFLYLVKIFLESSILIRIKSSRISKLANKLTSQILPFSQNRDNTLVSLLGIFLLSIPYLLFVIGDRSLVGTWILTRSSVTSELEFMPFSVAIGFIFLITARLGFVSVFLFLGLLLLPISKISINGKGQCFLLATLLFFPFLSLTLYFYQALSIVFVILSVQLIFPFLIGFNNYLHKLVKRKKKASSKIKIDTEKIKVEITSYYPDMRLKKPKIEKRITSSVVIFGLLCMTLGMSIQFIRYTYEGASLPSDLETTIEEFEEMLDYSPNVVNITNWTPYQLEIEDSFTVDEVVNLTSRYGGPLDQNDWIYSNISGIEGPLLYVEFRYRTISNYPFVGPYLLVSNGSKLGGKMSQSFTIHGSNNWNTVCLRIDVLHEIKSIGFRIVTTPTRSGPGSLILDYVKIASESVSLLASNQGLAQTLGYRLPEISVFPMSQVLILSTFGTSVNYNIYQTFDFSMTGITQFLRKGPFRMEIEVFDDLNELSSLGSSEEFLPYIEQFNILYLCHDSTDRWILLENLLEAELTTLVSSNGDYDLYEVLLI